MKDAGIGLRIRSLSASDHHTLESPSASTHVEILGNRDGLLRLAEEIRALASKPGSDYHIHIVNDIDEPLMTTKDSWLTFTLRSGNLE